MTIKERILEYIMSKGFTQEEAEKIYTVYTHKKYNVIKTRGMDGSWHFTHGGFGDREVMINALNIFAELK